MNCDPLARWYRWLEYAAFGGELQQRRECFLPMLGGACQALVLGDGDGRFSAALLRAHPGVRLECVDNSREMLRIARQRVPGKSLTRINLRLLDARKWQPGDSRYDLIVTHFFLDCFTTDELAPLIARIAAAATPDACWIVSEFRQPVRGWAAWRAKVWIAGLYRLFGWTTGLLVRQLPDYTALLEKHGFRREQAVTSEWGLLISECWRRV